MKKNLLILAMMLLPLYALADAVEIDGIYYNLIEKGKVAEVTRNPNKYTGDIVIPEKVTYNDVEYSVGAIGNSAFIGCSGLTSITIPNSVTNIDESAFNGCSSLTSITIPNSVTSIEQRAFIGCSSLTSITIPNSVKSIGQYAFYGCSGLTSITIPNSVTNIDESAFSGCNNLASVNITDLTAWCAITFKDAYSNPLAYAHHLYIDGHEVKELNIPSSVISIGSLAFYGCSGLTSITIPNSVTSIGELAFYDCSSLTSITIPNSVTSIGINAFRECSSLTSITIPNSVTSIGQFAFSGCSGLTSITIPNGVTSIGLGTFSNCSGLTSITIPNSVMSIGGQAFEVCSGLTSITIPNSVTSIGGAAFSGCTGLTSITIPNSVTNIAYETFKSCIGLTFITIPNSVTCIGRTAFSGCSGLTSITIPNSVTSIGSEAFRNCSGLTSITIPNSVTYIEQKAFADCSKVEDVYCYAERVPTTKTDAFKDSYPQYATLHVPASAINDYKATAPWSEFGTIKAIDGGEAKKCAKPTISYDNFKLTYNCETEGVEYISEIKDADVKKYFDNSVSLGATYEISVYATKSGYDNSDVATATLVFTNATFTTEGASSAKSMNMNPLLIQANDGFITVEGMAEGQRMAIYLSDGKQVATATSSNGKASVATNIEKGNTFIVKVGEKAVKVVMK